MPNQKQYVVVNRPKLVYKLLIGFQSEPDIEPGAGLESDSSLRLHWQQHFYTYFLQFEGDRHRVAAASQADWPRQSRHSNVVTIKNVYSSSRLTMNHWGQLDSGWYPAHGDGDSESSNQLQLPQPAPPWGLPASGDPTVTPGLTLASEILPAHNATTVYSTPDPHWQDCVGGSHPGFDSQFQVENGSQPGSASQAADAAIYDSNSPTGGGQYHPLVSDIPVSDTTSYSFQPSHSQQPAAGGSQHQPPAFGMPAPNTSYTYQASSSQPADASSEHQPLASGTAAPITPYMYQGSSSQPADGSQRQSLASGTATPIAPYMYQGSSSQPAYGSEHQPPAPVIHAPIAPYMYQGSSSQEPAG
ncbi:hypothetical protein DFJ58DRAFT_849044, partial [Suillus subalutaceus]|uniref:uncharacterized protein n=1 Tax=Suillus subalutaceus TaxID=48586 RepID=UPI001B881B89